MWLPTECVYERRLMKTRDRLQALSGSHPDLVTTLHGPRWCCRAHLELQHTLRDAYIKTSSNKPRHVESARNTDACSETLTSTLDLDHLGSSAGPGPVCGQLCTKLCFADLRHGTLLFNAPKIVRSFCAWQQKLVCGLCCGARKALWRYRAH